MLIEPRDDGGLRCPEQRIERPKRRDQRKRGRWGGGRKNIATYCNALQLTATRCNREWCYSERGGWVCNKSQHMSACFEKNGERYAQLHSNMLSWTFGGAVCRCGTRKKQKKFLENVLKAKAKRGQRHERSSSVLATDRDLRQAF